MENVNVLKLANYLIVLGIVTKNANIKLATKKKNIFVMLKNIFAKKIVNIKKVQ